MDRFWGQKFEIATGIHLCRQRCGANMRDGQTIYAYVSYTCYFAFVYGLSVIHAFVPYNSFWVTGGWVLRK